MDWQTMVAFSFIFWSTHHLLNVVKDWQRHKELTRIIRDMDTLSGKIDRAFPPKGEDTIKRVK